MAVAAACSFRHFLQALRIRGIGRSHHQQGIDRRRDALHGFLAVRRSVANVFLVGADDRRKTLLQRLDDALRVVDGQRRLGHEGEGLRQELRAGCVGHAVYVGDVLDEQHGAFRQLTQGPHHLRMAGMADQDDGVAPTMVQLGLTVHLGDERARGVDGEETTSASLHRNGLRDAMGREDHGRIGRRDLVQFLDKDGTLLLQRFDHVLVVDDLVPDEDRGAIDRESLLDRVDRANHAGAETARGAEQDLQRRLCHRAVPKDIGEGFAGCGREGQADHLSGRHF